ncbi:hypothetical protein BB560_002117 [Smittium megazygosporum]|uniref:Ribosomal biogenesis protein LAS1L n=1 Tax=Smittium megazygosporum TaxID=133381 RepID=A0A2T9ZFP8_9FUNG|nr:hypothetical protein BB560_002117 [Smittium megazygosporum]
MEALRIVPWSNTAEFDLACKLLYYDSDNEAHTFANRRRGLEILKLWCCRSNVPTTIQVTAQLLEAWLYDHENKSKLSSLMEKRLMYAMSLIRFVNLLVDTEQKGQYASSIISLAEKLGIPVWLVELRHAAAHEKLPGIELLRLSIKNALEYLYENYWSLQLQNLYQVLPSSATLDSEAFPKEISVSPEESILSLLDEFKNQRIRYLSAVLSRSKAKPDFKKYAQVLTEIGKSMHKDAMVSLLIPLLLEPGTGVMVVPPEISELKKLVNVEPNSKKAKVNKRKRGSLSSPGLAAFDFSSLASAQKEYLLKVYSPIFDCWYSSRILRTTSFLEKSLPSAVPLLQFQSELSALFLEPNLKSKKQINIEEAASFYSSEETEKLLSKVQESEQQFKANIESIAKENSEIQLGLNYNGIDNSNASCLRTEAENKTMNVDFLINFNQINEAVQLRFVDAGTWKPSQIGCLPNNVLPKLDL